jgi:hypothetical protein
MKNLANQHNFSLKAQPQSRYKKPNNGIFKSLASLGTIYHPLDTTDSVYCLTCNKTTNNQRAVSYIDKAIYKCSTCLKLIK